MKVDPYYNISSFIGFRTKEERLKYENILDFNKNWYDRASYGEFASYEHGILDFMKKLYQGYFQWGFLTIDSSEAIYTALLIQLLRFRKIHPEITKPNFLVSRFGHLVFKKAAVLLNVNLIEIEPENTGSMNLVDLKSKINEETFCVVGIAGTTELGNYDNIIETDRICHDEKVPLHIDAAIGGFIFPFKKNSKIPLDFATLKSALTINISGHKYGYARPSAGILLLKKRSVIPKSFYPVTTTYLPGGPSDEYALMGSKPAIGLIDLHYNITEWKEKGFQNIVRNTFQRKNELIESLKNLSTKISIYDSGDTPIFLVYGEKEFINNLSQNLNKKGWQSSAHHNYLLNKFTIRIVVRKHFTKQYNSSLISEIANSIKPA